LEQFIPTLFYVVGFVAFIWIAQFSVRKLLDFRRRQKLMHANHAFDVEPLKDILWLRGHAQNFRSLRFKKIVNGFETHQKGRRGCVFDYFLVRNDGEGSTREWSSASVIELNSPWTFKIIREGRLGKFIPSALVRTNLSPTYSIHAEEGIEIPSTLRDNIKSLLVDEVISEVDVQADALLVRPRTIFLARRIPRSISEWCLLGVRLFGLNRDYAPPEEFWKLLEKGIEIAEQISLESERGPK